MSKRERIAERANNYIVKAMDALDRASELAEEVEDWYAAGRIDAVRDALNSADLVVEATHQRPTSGEGE